MGDLPEVELALLALAEVAAEQPARLLLVRGEHEASPDRGQHLLVEPGQHAQRVGVQHQPGLVAQVRDQVLQQQRGLLGVVQPDAHGDHLCRADIISDAAEIAAEHAAAAVLRQPDHAGLRGGHRHGHRHLSATAMVR